MRRSLLRTTTEPISHFRFRINTALGDGTTTFDMVIRNFIGTIDWGDGTTESNTTSGTIFYSHTYSSAGIYEISFDAAVEVIANGGTDIEKVIFLDWGDTYGTGSTDQRNVFRDYINLTELGNGTGDFSSVQDFSTSFVDAPIENFPANVFNNTPTTDYAFAFFGCALNQQGVDNILVSINQARLNGVQVGSTKRLDITDGTSATPSATGQLAADQLRADGWTVNLNGY